MSEDTKKTKVIYMGRRISNKGDLLHCYSKAGDIYDIFYLKNKLGDYPVGMIIETNDYGDFFKPPYVGIDKIGDEAKITSWKVQDELCYAQVTAEKKWNKLGKNNRYQAIVDELNILIASLPPSQKRAFIFKLLSDLKQE